MKCPTKGGEETQGRLPSDRIGRVEPMRAAVETAKGRDAVAPSELPDDEVCGEAATPATVLLVAGRRAALDDTAAFLSADGYRVRAAASSEAAFDLFLDERPDILVVELAIVDAGGQNLLRCVRVLDERVAVIVQCDGLDMTQRRRLVRELALHGTYNRNDDTGRILELLESAVASVRRIDGARAAQELRGLILTKFCHELRTALHVIRGYTEILGNESVASAADEIVARLDTATDTALGLAQDYLNLARLDAPGVAVRREAVDIDALFAELCAAGGRQVGGRSVQFTATVPFAGACIDTDGEKLRAILAQLLANAAKFTLSGEIRLRLRLELDRTEFVVSDTGSGIRADELPSVFTPFRQWRDDAASSLPGQGVGLAIAARLSTLLGASLAASSRTQTGAVFTLSFPLTVSRRDDRVAATIH
jgi:signal transduction histidine kinase